MRTAKFPNNFRSHHFSFAWDNNRYSARTELVSSMVIRYVNLWLFNLLLDNGDNCKERFAANNVNCDVFRLSRFNFSLYFVLTGCCFTCGNPEFSILKFFLHEEHLAECLSFGTECKAKEIEPAHPNCNWSAASTFLGHTTKIDLKHCRKKKWMTFNFQWSNEIFKFEEKEKRLPLDVLSKVKLSTRWLEKSAIFYPSKLIIIKKRIISKNNWKIGQWP